MAHDHADEAVYCEACGDCLKCYGEDPCPNTESGEHVRPEEEDMMDYKDLHKGPVITSGTDRPLTRVEKGILNWTMDERMKKTLRHYLRELLYYKILSWVLAATLAILGILWAIS